MTFKISALSLTFILISVGFSSLAQILLKAGMSHPNVQSSISHGTFWPTVLAVVGNGYVLGGLFTYALSAVVWLFVLARLPLSTAYPFVGLGFILTMILAALLFGESLTLAKISGTVIVVLGLFLIVKE
jgi:drug/metabolite transporter (DMT)-like permease